MLQNKKQLLILMVLSLFTTQACTDIFLPGLPNMAIEFSASISSMNSIVSAFNYSQAFFVLFIGVFSDLFGRRFTILSCLLIHIIASCLIAISISIPFIITMRVLQALGGAAIYIVFRLVIKDTMDKKEQIHVTGILVIGLVLSPIVAPLLGSILINLYDWRACFWAISIIETPILFFLFIYLRETNFQQTKYRKSFNIVTHIINFLVLFRSCYFISISLIVGTTFAAFYSFLSISSYIYIFQFGIKNSYYSLVFILIAFAYLLGNRIMSRLNYTNIGEEKIIKYGIIASITGTIILLPTLLFQNNIMILGFITISVCLLRLATALINPPSQVLVSNFFQENSSHALGLITCIQYIFAGLGTMTVSTLPFYPSVNFTVCSVIFVCLSVLGFMSYSKNMLRVSNA